MSGSVERYDEKRDLRSTPEPSGEEGDTRKDEPIFVVQEHDASSHHYDFRLEVDGVLRSWAVPEGPSTDPSEKRLAVPTEDHPLEYADFEGVIPEDEYGGGTVILWDRGTWKKLERNEDREKPSLSDQLDEGHATFRLDGEKLSGGYALQRIEEGDDERWLLVKMDDGEADARRNPVSTEPGSVKTGRTVEEVAEEEGGGEDAGEEDGGEEAS